MNRRSKSRAEERLTDLKLLVVVLTESFSRVDTVLKGKLQKSAQILGEGQLERRASSAKASPNRTSGATTLRTQAQYASAGANVEVQSPSLREHSPH